MPHPFENPIPRKIHLRQHRPSSLKTSRGPKISALLVSGLHVHDFAHHHPFLPSSLPSLLPSSKNKNKNNNQDRPNPRTPSTPFFLRPPLVKKRGRTFANGMGHSSPHPERCPIRKVYQNPSKKPRQTKANPTQTKGKKEKKQDFTIASLHP